MLKTKTANRVACNSAYINSLAKSGKDVVNYQAMLDFVAAQPADGVTSVTAGTGLTATPNPIVTTGTLGLADTAVTPGSYSFADLTTNQQGQVTSAASGSPTFPMIFKNGSKLGVTGYFGGDSAASFAFFSQGLPMDATLVGAYVICEVAPGIGQSYQFEFGGVPVLSITETDTSASITGLSTSYSEGEFLAARVVYSGGADTTGQTFVFVALMSPD